MGAPSKDRQFSQPLNHQPSTFNHKLQNTKQKSQTRNPIPQNPKPTIHAQYQSVGNSKASPPAAKPRTEGASPPKTQNPKPKTQTLHAQYQSVGNSKSSPPAATPQPPKAKPHTPKPKTQTLHTQYQNSKNSPPAGAAPRIEGGSPPAKHTPRHGGGKHHLVRASGKT